MIIKEIRIKNFRSYYGDNNRFEFSKDGLTLILGDNGDGKTTLFEAIQWLLDTTVDRGRIEHVSEMRKSKLEIGEHDEVLVSIKFEHNDCDIEVEKSFTFERKDATSYLVSNISYRGYQTIGAERESVSGKVLINRCYDAFIQRFSMFKGESDLKVFDDKTALKVLVDKFSDVRKFDFLVDTANLFEDNSNKAYLKEMKSDEKVSKEANALDFRITKLSSDIRQKEEDINDKRASVELFSAKLNQLEQNQESCEKYQDIQKRLTQKENDAMNLRGKIGMVDYNHSLLDRQWILCAFPKILKEFQNKCSSFSKEKRKQEKDFDKRQAAEKAKLDTIKEIQGALINGATELPWYLPNQETMEDMLHDHICKVCGRPAEEGSDAYNFMMKKLEDYKRHVEAQAEKQLKEKVIDDAVLFKYSFIEQLHTLSVSMSGENEAQVSSIARQIKDRLELVETYKTKLKEIENKIQDIKDDKARLLIQVGNIPETMLESQFHDIKGLFEQKENAQVRLTELTKELYDLKSQMKDMKSKMEELNPASSQVKLLRDVHHMLEEIAKAVTKAKDDNLANFLSDLEKRANVYVGNLSANDFHGEVRLIQTAKDSTEIRLFSSNGTEIKKPSGSQKTVMYISVLFAISDFTQQKRDEAYPLIFDAATSSFGDSKEKDFYNIINNIKKQCIIVTKDFITSGKVRTKDLEGLDCPIYRIKKAEGFDPNNMATIRTTIERIK